MMKYLLMTLVLLPSLAMAQKIEDESKYMEGAVPERDGKVVFAKEVQAPGLSREEIYEAARAWAQTRFIPDEENDNWGAVLYVDEKTGQIVCNGGEYIVFTDKTFSLDRAKIGYRFNIACEPGVCRMEMTGIFYFYPESSRERIAAEGWITDDVAINKKKHKLAFRVGKFRAKTVDLAESLFAGAEAAIGAVAMTAGTRATVSTTTSEQPRGEAPRVTTVTTTVSAPAKEEAQGAPAAGLTGAIATTEGAELEGYKRIDPKKIPGNIIGMLADDWMLITAGRDSLFNPMTAGWGGLGQLYNLPVAFCFINPSRYTYQLMEEGETYTLTFYTEAYREALQYCGTHSGRDGDKVKAAGLTPITTPSGSKAFAEAWMIIECRKLVAQPLQQGAIYNADIRHEWDGKKMHQMYIGEIINVWVK